VEIYRANVMTKMNAASPSELCAWRFSRASWARRGIR
jgi:FixJ family two-component response regulator